MKRIAIAIAVLVLALPVLIWLDGGGQPETAGDLKAPARGDATIAAGVDRQRSAGVADPRQVLFGDLHVHSTFSMDAFLMSLPMMQGEGMHPPADACDFARHCAALDFWSLTDHAESLTPRHWLMIKDTVRRCDSLADPDHPDLVTLLGFEWTQVGLTPETHFGHRNVHFLETAEDRVPARPITSGGLPLKHMRRPTLGPVEEALAPYITDFGNRQALKDVFYKQAGLRETPDCTPGAPVRSLDANCIESAETPEDLFERLAQWETEHLVIPHGTTWGFYTPPGVRWDKQLTRARHDPARAPLIEVFSGHGNSEQHRDWRAVDIDADGRATCPSPSPDYEPCCHRAGELIRARCTAADPSLCEAYAAKARQDYVEAGVAGHLVVPGTVPEDWGACGQCTECYLPALNYRPGNSVQYITALSNFDEPGPDGAPFRFRFGFIASSDNHNAQPGTGYKERGRHKFTDVIGPTNERARERFGDVAKRTGQGAESIPFDRSTTRYNLFQYAETERQASFFYTGGLVAAHSVGRTREALWDALKRREVYATSGDRILLWFDLVNGPIGRVPMGSEVALDAPPRFEVRAVGAFEQKPGCPPDATDALGAARMASLCAGECYHPGNVRKPITHIEVVRIRPQAAPGESMTALIEDPWQVLPCPDGGGDCIVQFEDPEFPDSARDAVYYVRALQAPTPTVNGAPLGCTDPGCEDVTLCHADQRTAFDDDCLAPAAERAWSSPIFVDRPRAASGPAPDSGDAAAEAPGA